MDIGSMVFVAWYGLEFVVAAVGTVVGHEASGPAGPRVIVVAPAEACSRGLAPADRPDVLCGEER